MALAVAPSVVSQNNTTHEMCCDTTLMYSPSSWSRRRWCHCNSCFFVRHDTNELQDRLNLLHKLFDFHNSQDLFQVSLRLKWPQQSIATILAQIVQHIVQLHCRALVYKSKWYVHFFVSTCKVSPRLLLLSVPSKTIDKNSSSCYALELRDQCFARKLPRPRALAPRFLQPSHEHSLRKK